VTGRPPRPRIPVPPAPSAAAWRDRAACRGADLKVFFPDRGESAEPARQVCAGCPVRQPCLDYAISHGEGHGIWGGLTGWERRALRTCYINGVRGERDAAITAASDAGYTKAAIGRAFGLAATSVSRVLSSGTDRRRRS
jgi:WhiB family transcriptional regulator, redox-sensing transcriptional regulator